MLRRDFRGAAGSGATAPSRRTSSGRRYGSPIFRMRLTPEERVRLEAEAGETSLATYIKLRLFSGLPPLTALGGSAKPPASELQLIAKLLAALGESRIANNLNQLAKAANMGTLETGPDMERELLEACAAVQSMRRDLITALGLRPDRRK